MSDRMQFPCDEEPNNTVLHPVVFVSPETCYSNTEREALGLENFHHYCFTHELSRITDHKLLVTMFKKDVATMSQSTILGIFQCNMRVL